MNKLPGHVQSNHNLGVMAEQGQGMKRDPVAAVRFFKAGADQGYGESAYNLALMYGKGDGVCEQAYKWFLKAADR